MCALSCAGVHEWIFGAGGKGANDADNDCEKEEGGRRSFWEVKNVEVFLDDFYVQKLKSR